MTRPSGISWGEEEAEQEEEPTERPGGVARENRRGGFRADSEISPILEGWFATPLCVCVPRACVRGRGHPFSSRETPNLLTLVHLLPTDRSPASFAASLCDGQSDNLQNKRLYHRRIAGSDGYVVGTRKGAYLDVKIVVKNRGCVLNQCYLLEKLKFRINRSRISNHFGD